MDALTQQCHQMEQQIERLHHLIEDHADQSAGANPSAIAAAKQQALHLEEVLHRWCDHTLALIEQLDELATETAANTDKEQHA